jgi:formylmethanofuran dehydrogenase subunit E
MTYEEIVHFHGHECPGLAIGYRMATAAMEFHESFRAAEELVLYCFLCPETAGAKFFQ